jgi:hypothetical protein
MVFLLMQKLEWVRIGLRHIKTNYMAFSDQIIKFLQSLSLTVKLPNRFEVLNPFSDKETLRVSKLFYKKYYHDDIKRRMILGINPGRFGAGITGVPFTDPIRIEKVCGIENTWVKKQELSSVFIYQMIEAYGGVEEFYKQFYITAVSPLGFIKEGKNINYYDDRELQKDVKPFVIECMNKQLKFGIKADVAYCLGEGKNYDYLKRLNDEMHFFNKIIALPHPRFIMQYKTKKKEEYIQKYLNAFYEE